MDRVRAYVRNPEKPSQFFLPAKPGVTTCLPANLLCIPTPPRKLPKMLLLAPPSTTTCPAAPKH